MKDEFERSKRNDINAVQAILLFNIGDEELTAGELRSRGYYFGSNVSYNVKKLTDMGFINHEKSSADKRSVRISLTEKGREVAAVVRSLYDRHSSSIEAVGGIGSDEFTAMNRAMQSRAGDSSTFDTFLDGALKRFQERHGMVADGVVGNYTLKALNVPRRCSSRTT